MLLLLLASSPCLSIGKLYIEAAYRTQVFHKKRRQASTTLVAPWASINEPETRNRTFPIRTNCTYYYHTRLQRSLLVLLQWRKWITSVSSSSFQKKIVKISAWAASEKGWLELIGFFERIARIEPSWETVRKRQWSWWQRRRRKWHHPKGSYRLFLG